MGFGSLIGGLFKPATELVDELHTSTEEKLEAKEKLTNIFVQAIASAAEYEAKILSEAAQTVRAEANGHSWIQRNWRPLIMLMFGYIIAHNYIVVPISHWFGAMTPVLELPADLWDLLKIGIGGYTVGRSVEKIVPSVVEVLKKPDQTKEK